MISVNCSQCGTPLRVRDELQGKRVKCPACGEPIIVASVADGGIGVVSDKPKRLRPVRAERDISRGAAGADADLPCFLNIGAAVRGFSIRQKKNRLRQSAFAGMVVASPDAHYFAVNRAVANRETLFGISDPDVEEMELEDLPAEVSGHPDWPLPWTEGRVLVVPRQAVQGLRTSFLLGGIEAELQEVRILVFTPLFRRKHMAAYLKAAGWEVDGAPDIPFHASTRARDLSAADVARNKTARVARIVGVVLILFALGLVLWNWKWVQSAVQGPVPINLADLRHLEDPARLPNPWVSFRFDHAQDTGLRMNRTGLLSLLEGNNRSKYMLIQVQNQWLIAELAEDHVGNDVTGYLDTWGTPLRREVRGKTQNAFPNLDILPFQFDGHYSYRKECYSLLVLAGVLFLAGTYLVLVKRSSVKKR